ncbi:hypothetical protein ACIBG8_36035 [Nonomuraea sp. NPDC050556]|uniref:hypothetical protein n=1 Tax=Nonomuraea sp. NPDC050556 TaxID=3364369 RepID=UPI00378AF818
MRRFKRLTVEEAGSLTRDKLLARIEEEQRYWYRRIQACTMRPGDDAAFRTFNEIMDAAVRETLAEPADAFTQTFDH